MGYIAGDKVLPGPKDGSVYPSSPQDANRIVTAGDYNNLRETVNELITAGPGGGGVTDHENLTGLQGGAVGEHYHLTQSDHDEIAARSTRLGFMGIWVGATAPVTPITYAAWVAGGSGYWAWIEV